MSTRGVSPVIVGRGEQLAALEAALGRGRDGGASTFLIGGEAGVGKSRLATEFAGRATAVGTRVLAGGCPELGAGGLPFAPFTAVLRQLVRDLGAPGVADLLPGQAPSELGRLLPELGVVPASPVDGYAGEPRARLFEQMLALLEQLAERDPVLLIIEDVHWADRSTRDLLSFLVSNQRILEGVLLVVTFRSDELHRTHPLRPLLAELSRIGWVQRIELPRLSRHEAAEQVAGILAGEPEPAVVDAVYARSEGNPLFVEELLCCDGELPASLRDLVLASVRRLPPDTQEVLRVASVGGGRVGHALLARVTGMDDDSLYAAVRPAVAANVLLPDSAGYAFRHELIREAMYDDLLPGEHSRLHARFAEAIAADPGLLPGGRAAIQLAHHWYLAHDMTRALVSAWRAAAEAECALAYAEQLTMLSRVLELWDKVPGAAQRIGADHVGVLEEAIRIANYLGEHERGSAFAAAALREVDAEAEPARAAQLLERRATVGDACGVGEIDDLREALRLVGDDEHAAVRAKVLASLALMLSKTTGGAEARSAATEAFALASASDDFATQASALISLAMLGPDDSPRCEGDLDLLARAREAAGRAGDYHILLTATINESDALEGMGEHERAAGVARSGVADAQRYGLARTAGTFLAINLAEPLVSLGRWDEAAEVISRALDLSTAATTRAAHHLLSGYIALARGDLSAARNAADTAAVAVGGLPRGIPYRDQYHLPAARLLLELRFAEGRFDDALGLVDQARSSYDLQSSPRYAWPLMVTAARGCADVAVLPAAARTDDTAERAFALLEALRAEAAKLEVRGPVQRAYQLTFAAEVRRAGLDEPDGRTGRTGSSGAESAWAAAARAWEAVAEPYPLATALLRAAEAALAGRGSRDEAAQRLRRASELAVGLGAQSLLDQIALLATRARIRLGDGRVAAAPAGQAAAQGLTPRELEVLRLVAAGRSNAGIADELFISAKTASVHVSNILAKLRVASRGEAAAAAHSLHLLDVTPAA